jgi:hypothetical protein
VILDLRGRRGSVVAQANELVPIEFACRLIGMHLPDGLGYRRSTKLHCPFGELSHIDGGLEKAFRIYVDANSAYCFAGCGHFSPVWLVATAWGRDTRVVAAELLERIGHRPPSFRQLWAQVIEPDQTPDRTFLREALQTYCQRICPDWATRQFAPEVASTLTHALALLDRVHTEPDARLWLDGVKAVMGRVLTGAPVPPVLMSE